ncbi:hypothetical protein ACEYYH_02130 [Microbacterium trichothecenolyticum]|uniref:hypothetical protein n=1 Tax=Microbacterium trichothecenolyticum TaxID=69370 RepID=UPI0035BE2643
MSETKDSSEYHRGFVPRPKSRALSHVAWWSYLWFLPLMVAALIGWQSGNGLAWIAVLGEGVSESLDWSLSIMVSVLLAFYAVSIGGQLLQLDKLASTRNILGIAGAAIGAAAILLGALVAAYAFTEPSAWGTVIALVPVTGIVLFLVLHLGFQMNVSLAKRRHELQEDAARLDETANRLNAMWERKPDRGRVLSLLGWLTPSLMGLLCCLGALALSSVDADVWSIFTSAWVWLLGCLVIAVILTTFVGLGHRYRFREVVDSAGMAYLPLIALWVVAVLLLAPLLSSIVPVDSASDGLLTAAIAGWVTTLTVASWPLKWTSRRLPLPSIAELELWRAQEATKMRTQAVQAELAALPLEESNTESVADRIRSVVSKALSR